jgi:hypothetical protein
MTGRNRAALMQLGRQTQLKDPNDAIRVSRLVQQKRRLELRFMELGLDTPLLFDAMTEFGATHMSAESDDL